MFLLDWINEYMNTPKIEMTTEIEMLALVAIGIIALIIIGIISAVWGIGAKIAEYIRKKR